jgi:hypothetical protein
MVIRAIISYWGIDKLLALLRCKDDERKRLKKVTLVARHISGITFIRHSVKRLERQTILKSLGVATPKGLNRVVKTG